MKRQIKESDPKIEQLIEERAELMAQYEANTRKLEEMLAILKDDL